MSVSHVCDRRTELAPARQAGDGGQRQGAWRQGVTRPAMGRTHGPSGGKRPQRVPPWSCHAHRRMAFWLAPRWRGTWRWLVDVALLGYAALGIVAWLEMGRPNPLGLGYLSKGLEIGLMRPHVVGQPGRHRGRPLRPLASAELRQVMRETSRGDDTLQSSRAHAGVA